MTRTPCTLSAPHNAVACLFAALASISATSTAFAQQPISYDAAWNRVKTVSDKLGAAQAAVESGVLAQKGMQGLGGPIVSLSAAALAYDANLSVDLDPLNQSVTQLAPTLPAQLRGLLASIPRTQLPTHYTYNQSDSLATSSISAVWPIYAGGAADATRNFVKAQHGEAEAELSQAQHETATQLAQRYFGAQLAIKASNLRDAAFKGIEQHDTAADKMLKAGVIARVERLQARTALEDARRNASKAKSDAELATAALARMLKADGPIVPQTPLFVMTQPLEPLDQFVRAALDNHPGLAKVASKRSQAQSLHEGEEALRKPQVFAFGQSTLTTSRPSWVAGVGVRWTLFDAVDRNALSAASMQKIKQAELTDAQARSDIALLVERNWRNAEQARRNFLSMQATIELAEEVLKLRAAGAREGTSTTLDLIDAELNLAKARTERAQSAYEFAVALAALLESCGMSEKFPEYISRADVKID